jgi:hypothetical protein
MSHFEMKPFILRELILGIIHAVRYAPGHAGGCIWSPRPADKFTIDAGLEKRGKTCARVVGTALALF